MPRPLFDSSYIFGLHDPGGENLMAQAGRRGWIVFTVETGSNPADTGGFDFTPWADAEYGVLCRVNNGYGSAGTIPLPSRYEDFARRVANFVAASRGCKLWVIGNEMNHAQEWPLELSITPNQYAECFRQCRDAIHALPGHADDQVIVGAVAPWNNQVAYTGNEMGDWVRYFADILALLGEGGLDGIALHTYTHGADPGLITSDAKMDALFGNRHFHFRAYRDFLDAVPSTMRGLPVYITEADQDEPWHNLNNGWVQAAYEEIDRWNVQGGQQIRCLALYRWPPYDRWAICDKGGVQEDFRAAMQHNYCWRESAAAEAGRSAPLPAASLLAVGDTFRTVEVVHLRQEPGTLTRILALIAAGAEGRVLGGPQTCSEGMTWYSVQVAAGWAGWMAEALPDGVRLLEKVNPGSQVEPQTGADVLSSAVWLTVRAGPGLNAETRGLFWPGATVFAEPEATERDGFTWRQVAGVGIGGQVVRGWAAQQQADGTVLLAEAQTSPRMAAPFAGQHRISQLWGENPAAYSRFVYEGVALRGHNGIDFATPVGTAILAVDAGEVYEAAYDADGFGWYVLLRHDWGESLYAHLSNLGVIAGKTVVGGEWLGLSGNTGNSTGPHLHFSVRINPYQRGDGWGGYNDPLPYLPRASLVLPNYLA